MQVSSSSANCTISFFVPYSRVSNEVEVSDMMHKFEQYQNSPKRALLD
jgi:hypothetical protein